MANHHEHSHHHEHHIVPASLNKIFIFCIALNLLFVVIEAGVGFIYNSLGLLSDAGHNLSDVFSLLLALVAFRMAKLHATHHFTYGYKKATILISLVNAVILLVAVGAILIESIYKLKHPVPVSGQAISWTAGIGILINGLTTWLLMRDRKKDLNVQGAFLHMMMDTLVSVGVVISGILISYTGWNWIDSIISLLIAAVILFSTFGLLKESLFLSIDGTSGKHSAGNRSPSSSKKLASPAYLGNQHYRECRHSPYCFEQYCRNGNGQTPHQADLPLCRNLTQHH